MILVGCCWRHAATGPSEPEIIELRDSPGDIAVDQDGDVVVTGRMGSDLQIGDATIAGDGMFDRWRNTRLWQQTRGAVSEVVEPAQPGATRSSADDTGTARLAAARAVAKVHDAAIVAVHDVGDNKGMPFIAREYVAGVEIERAATAVTSVVELRRWLTELASGLAAIHAGGVVHGGLGERGSLVIDAGRGRIGGFARGRVSVDAAARDDDVRDLRARINAALAAAAPVLGPRALASLRARIDAPLPNGDAGALALQLAADPGGRSTALVAAIAITAAIGFVALGRTLATAAPMECTPAAA